MKWNLIEESGDVSRAWQFARHYLNDHQDELDVIRMNLPVNSMKTYEFQIESSIMFRDLLLTVRPIAAWCVSNRVTDFNALHLDEQEASILGTYDKIQSKLNNCIDRVNAGEKKDYVKESLPLLTSTKFTIKIDLRTLLSFVYTLKLHSPKYFEIVRNELIGINHLNVLLTDKVLDTLNIADMYSKLSLSKDELELARSGTSKKLGEMHIISGTSSANIMAQFIRQHNSLIKNGLWNKFVDSPNEIMSADSSIIIPVLGYIEESAFNNLFTTRTCWFAQMDRSGSTSWDCILGDVVSKMKPEEFINKLPCHGDCNKCKIRNEMIPRVDGRDQNTPCPILIENPFMITERVNAYKSDSRIMSKWEECESLIRLNLSNKLNQKYMETIKNAN